MTQLRFADYFAIAGTRRVRASGRRRIRGAARLGMLLVIGAALYGCVWLVPFHPDSAGVLLVLNGALALVAATGYVAIATIARRASGGPSAGRVSRDEDWPEGGRAGRRNAYVSSVPAPLVRG